jgi:hypothetical protein
VPSPLHHKTSDGVPTFVRKNMPSRPLSLHCPQVIGISRNEELAWQAVEDLQEEFPGAAISYKVWMTAVHTAYGPSPLSCSPTPAWCGWASTSGMLNAAAATHVHADADAQLCLGATRRLQSLTPALPCLCGAQICNMEVLSEVQSVADELIASGKPIRWACQPFPFSQASVCIRPLHVTLLHAVLLLLLLLLLLLHGSEIA